MDFTKWEKVVVEWVNCLKLSKAISCLKDLKDGVFFSTLISVLIQDDTNTTKYLSYTLSLLNEQFSHFNFDYLKDLCFADILEIDLLIISSLLMYYTCIQDRRDILTSPLCNKLSQTTQVYVRAYLEKMKRKEEKYIDREDFFQIIDEVITTSISCKAAPAFGLQAGDSFTNQSPLQEILCSTALKSNRLHEKDREINQLRYEMDLERFEKEDLQSELEQQKEKNKKLNQQIGERSVEINKLRCEIVEFENRLLNDTDNESQELQRRLRGEINSLEKYTEQLQKELNDIYSDRESIKLKLKKVENQYLIWHDKAVTSEKAFDNLLEEHQQQEQQLHSFRAQCLELEALLEESRNTKQLHENSIEVDASLLDGGFQGLIYEDLAGAVVEVQLRDVQKENEELRNLLKDSQETAKNLNENLIIAKTDFVNLQIHYDEISLENNNLLDKVSILEKTYLDLQSTRQQLEESAHELTKVFNENVALNSNIAENKIKITEMENDNERLFYELSILKTDYAKLEVTFQARNETCNTLEKRISKIQFEYENLLDNYYKTDFNFQSLTQNLNQLEADMEQNLRELEKLILGKNTINLKNKNSAFEKLFTKLEENYSHQLNEKKTLVNKLSEFEELVAKLKVDLANLNEKEVINLQERETLSHYLKCSQQKTAVLEQTIANHVEKIQNLNCTIIEMNATIEDLEMLKDVLEQKGNIITELQEANTSLEIKLTKSNEELVQNKAFKEDLEKSIESLQQIKNDFETKIFETQRELSEKKENETKLSKTITELHTLTKVFEQEMLQKREELDECKKNEERLQQTVDNLEGLKISLRSQLLEASDELNEHRANECLLETTIFDNEKRYQEDINYLNLKIEDYITKINNLEVEFQNCNLHSIAAKKDLMLVTKSKQELENEIDNSKCIYNKQIHVLDATINKLEHKLEEAEKEKLQLQDKISQKNKEYKELCSLRDQDTSKCIELEDQLRTTLERLSVKEVECLAKDDLMSKKNQELLCMKLDVEEKNEQLKMLRLSTEEQEIEMQELNGSIIYREIKIGELNGKVMELQGECMVLENLKSGLKIKNDELESNVSKVILELSLKNEELERIIEEYDGYKNDTHDEIIFLKDSLKKADCELVELSSMKNTLISENTKQINSLKEKVLEQSEMLKSLNNKEVEHLETIRVTKDELNNTLMKYTEALQMQQEMHSDNELQINNLTENLHELVEKYNDLDKHYTNTLKELNTKQKDVETLEDIKTELESKLIEQNLLYEAHFNTHVENLNSQLSELQQKEEELKKELLDVTEKLKVSEDENTLLSEKVKTICDELVEIRTERSELHSRLTKFRSSYQELKNMQNSLKEMHLEFVTNNCQNLSKLQTELSEQIGYLVKENLELKNTITRFKENVSELQSENEVLNALHLEKLKQNETTIASLQDDNKTYKAQIKYLQNEKQDIENQIALEKNKLDECRINLTNSIEEKNEEMEEYKVNIMKLQSANNILKTGKDILENDMQIIKDQIKDVEELRTVDEQRYNEEINLRDKEITNLTTKINILENQVTENVTKNNELLIELCSVNDSLELITKKYNTVEEVLKIERQVHSKVSSELASKVNDADNLQKDNEFIAQELTTTRTKIEELKEKLKTDLLHRQTLQLELKVVNEKLCGQESVIRTYESRLSETNLNLLQRLEDILVIEREKRTLHENVERLSLELERVLRTRDEILESQGKIIKETENNIIRAHENAIEVKNDLLGRIELVENEKLNEKELRIDLEKLLEGEKIAKEILEIRVLELLNEKSKFEQIYLVLKHKVDKLIGILNEKPVEAFSGDNEEFAINNLESLNSKIDTIKERILVIIEQNCEFHKNILILEENKTNIVTKIEQITNEKTNLEKEKEELIQSYDMLRNEKVEKENDLKTLRDVHLAHQNLQAKYDELLKCSKENLDLENLKLKEKLTNLEKRMNNAYNVYKKYSGYSTTYKTAIEKLIMERNVLEETLNNVKQKLSSVNQIEFQDIKLSEHAESFGFILGEINRHFIRISKKIYDIIFIIIQTPVDIYNIVNSESLTGLEDVLNKVDFEEELEKIVDCRNRVMDLQDQIVIFESSLIAKNLKPQKERLLKQANGTNSETKTKDDDLKKKNTMLRQKLTLSENARSNYEKKLKQLRQENKLLNAKCDVSNDVESYKLLEQQNLKTKEEYDKILSIHKDKYNKLKQEYDSYKAKKQFVPDSLKFDKEIKSEQVKAETEIAELKKAYGSVISNNSKLELENSSIRKILEDRDFQLNELKRIKEGYENLLEENDKLRTELDTVKYKRVRDREALAEAVRKNKDEQRKVEEMKYEYDDKLDEMKNKMLQHYKEVMEKEVYKHEKDHQEKNFLLKTIDHLKKELHDLKLEQEKSLESRSCEFCTSKGSSILSCSTNSCLTQDNLPVKGINDADIAKTLNTLRKKPGDIRKASTLPKSSMDVIKENSITKRNTLTSLSTQINEKLEMEDEDDEMFNNKYLADLKEGRCVISNSRESNANRLSELKWRNSLFPPHLKSSYPAETQFNTPTQFKDDDLKLGNIDFNDSMSTKLIPGDKPRKKDIGTTSYKKPGPPTPSKNGGRMSLQGNEPHPKDVLKEQNELKTPKRATPNRLKALFMGRNSSVRDNSENQPGTPKSRRLSIFRKK